MPPPSRAYVAAGAKRVYTMNRILLKIVISMTLLGSFACRANAIDFFFAPDTISGGVGDTVELSGQIGTTDLMRGFTVYIAYDTNGIDLSAPPVPGTLIADRNGLNFNYFDHVPIHPDRLEIGGTVFGTDFWSGPGELFRVRFVLRMCTDAPLTSAGAPFFVDANGMYPPVTFHPAVVLICPRVPAAVGGLTIYPFGSTAVMLRWPAVTADYLNRPLFTSPHYVVLRQQVLPIELPVQNVASTSDTSFVDPLETGVEYLYYIVAESEE